MTGRPKAWIKVPVGVLDDPDLTPTARLVYVALRRHTDYGTEAGARPSDATLAKMTGLHRNTILAARQLLYDTGWVSWETEGTSRRGKANAYTVRNEPDPKQRGRRTGADAPTLGDAEPAQPGNTPGDNAPGPAHEPDQHNEATPPAGGADQHNETTPPPAETADQHNRTTPTSTIGQHYLESVTESTNNNPAAAAFVDEPPHPGGATEPPQQQQDEFTIEPDMETAEMDATESMRAIVEELGDEYLETDFHRRRFRAAASIIIEGGASYWRNPHTGHMVPPDERPPLFRVACLHHFAEPANNLGSSLRYAMKVELDPYNVPDDSEAAGARQRETDAGGAPTCEDPVRPDVAAMVRPRTVARPQTSMEQRRERARAFASESPERYAEMRAETERRIRAKYSAPELKRMPARILEGEVLNDLERQIEDHERRGADDG